MTERTRRLALDPVSRNDEVGRWLDALDDARRRTLRVVRNIGAQELDWAEPPAQSVSTILYHLAAIEADWLCMEVMGLKALPRPLAVYFPASVRTAGGALTPVAGQSLESHLRRLDTVRQRLLKTYGSMTIEDFRSARPSGSDAEVTPEWVLHHLLQHEAEHRGGMADTLARYRSRGFATPGN